MGEASWHFFSMRYTGKRLQARGNVRARNIDAQKAHRTTEHRVSGVRGRRRECEARSRRLGARAPAPRRREAGGGEERVAFDVQTTGAIIRE
jgi:hypothetical protein